MEEQAHELVTPRSSDIIPHLVRPSWISVVIALVVISLPATAAFDPLDPLGKVLIRWDVMAWTGDGYTAIVNIINTQQFRGIKSYRLGWKWQKKEIIWAMQGAQATEQGDCSRVPTFRKPHSCSPAPLIIDLSSGTPYALQSANCCRDGEIAAAAQDYDNSVSESTFQITVGRTGNTNTTINIPDKLTLMSPDPGYTCSPLQKVAPTKFPSVDGKRVTKAFVTWNATCVYSQKLAHREPTCCVSLSAFYSREITPCAECACNCAPLNSTSPDSQAVQGTNDTCIYPNSRNDFAKGKKAPSLYCTRDMCRTKIHWHLKETYKRYWRAKITVTNRNLLMNYTNWNIVVQHPNFVNFTRSFNFTYKPLTPYGDTANDTAMFWGVKHYNDILMQAGHKGSSVQSELLFAKDSTFTLSNGWGFPSRVYFNGDNCVLPDPTDYPSFPNGSQAGPVTCDP